MNSKVRQWMVQNITSQEGKRFLITGANSGLGLELTKLLVGLNAEVIMAGRDQQRLADAMAEIITQTPEAKLELLTLDLADLDSVAAAPGELNQILQGAHIDVLVNNAGIMSTPYAISKQGYEMQFAVNHLGHFLLTMKLLPFLYKRGRVVNVSSIAHLSADANFAPKIQFEQYVPYSVYANTKLANILFTQKLNEQFKLQNLDLTAYVVHPGVSATNLFAAQIPDIPFKQTIANFYLKYLVGQSALMGALSLLYAATVPAQVLDETKLYGAKAGEMKPGYKGFPEPIQINPNIATADAKEKLWKISQDLVKGYI